MPPDSYYSSVNQDLLAMIPPDASRILEVGCGTGALASRYKMLNPKCEYWGVELDGDAFLEAQSNPSLHRTFNVDIERFGSHMEYIKSMSSTLAPEGPFDVMIFGDVLEHLQNPSTTLKDLVRDWLSPDGHVLACVPNVQNLLVVATLVNGDWPQHESGIFDSTHLRWFTKKTLVDMFKSVGLSVAKIRPRVFATDGVKAFTKAMIDSKFSADAKALEEGLSAFQWLIHGVKGELPNRKVLVRGFAAEGCCARPRLTEPGSFINTVPGFRYSETKTEVEKDESVIVVRQRFNITKEAVVQHLKAGCLIVGEWDDDPWYEGFKGKFKGIDVEWAIKACHAIQVSTEAIAELIRPVNPNVVVFQNQIKEIRPAKEFDDTTDVVRVFMGGQRRREDWEDAVETVNRIILNDWERYHFVVVYDRQLYDALNTTRKTFYPLQPYEKYRELLRSCDVAISTLADNRFNRCKSDITRIECGAEGTPVLDGDYGLEPDSITEYRRTLYLDGDAQFQYVLQRRLLRDHYRSRVDWYDGLLDRKSELDQMLFERLPELKEVVV